MCGPLILAGLTLPLLEIYLFVLVGRQIGAMETVLLVMAAAGFGFWIATRQGNATIARLRGGEVPADVEILGGPLKVLAALLLVIPGFLSDAMGLLLLVPPVRRAVARYIARRFGGPGGPGGGQVIIIRRP